MGLALPPRAPQITPAPPSPPELLRRQNGAACGDLGSKYPLVPAPVCTGSYPFCTFSASLQGCCNSAGSCQFYTTCNGHLASITGPSYLSCPSSAAYCTKYNFLDQNNGGHYDAYSCGTIDIGTTVISGVAASATVTGNSVTSTARSSGTAASPSSSPSSSSSQSTSSPTASSSRPASTTLSTSTTASHTPTATVSAVPDSTHLSRGATAGIAIGCVAGVVAALLIWWCISHRRRPNDGGRIPQTAQLQQNVRYSRPN